MRINHTNGQLVVGGTDSGRKPLNYEKAKPLPRNILLDPIAPPMRRIQGMSDEEYERLEQQGDDG